MREYRKKQHCNSDCNSECNSKKEEKEKGAKKEKEEKNAHPGGLNARKGFFPSTAAELRKLAKDYGKGSREFMLPDEILEEFILVKESKGWKSRSNDKEALDSPKSICADFILWVHSCYPDGDPSQNEQDAVRKSWEQEYGVNFVITEDAEKITPEQEAELQKTLEKINA